MIQREVTIGRAPNSDILYNHNCVHISNAHAVIYSNGNQLIFKDTSTNGTLINNMQVHHQSIVISYGDSILLAGKYPLTWDRIGIFFPRDRVPTQFNNEYNPNVGSQNRVSPQLGMPYEAPPADNKSTFAASNNATNIEVETTRFNWGAFFLYSLWGFANGMWWTFLIGIFFGWTIIPNILFGIMGSKWAWQNKQWRNLEHFISVQNSWKKWGIGLFIGSLALTILFGFMIGFLAAAL